MEILNTTLIGFLAGTLGTGIGALLTLIFKKPSNSLMSAILGFSGGIMTAVVCFDLIPEAIKEGGLRPALLGLIAGSLLIMLLDFVTPHAHFFADNDCGRFVRTGVLLGIGVAMHNLPEGLAIGAGYAHSTQLGLGLALIISLQNAPEGVAMATPMLVGGLKPIKILIYAVLAGIPMGIGAFLGGYFGDISCYLLSFYLGFAGGAMLYITFDELIPQSQGLHKGHSATFGAVAGIIVGITISRILGV